MQITIPPQSPYASTFPIINEDDVLYFLHLSNMDATLHMSSWYTDFEDGRGSRGDLFYECGSPKIYAVADRKKHTQDDLVPYISLSMFLCLIDSRHKNFV